MYKYTIRIAMLAILTPLLFTVTVKSQALTNQIEEIIVTAQKTEQNLQDVPIAVSAFDSDAIALKQLDNFMDVQLAMPNVHFVHTNKGFMDLAEKEGLKVIRDSTEVQTTLNEQRQTKWMPFKSYESAILETNQDRTVENFSAPKRKFYVLERLS